MIAFQGISQTDTKDDKLICLPAHILRLAAEDLQNGDACKLLLENRIKDISYLDSLLFYTDSCLYEMKGIHADDSAIISANQIKEAAFQADNDRLKKQYRKMKVNDRLKMAGFTAVIVGLVYAIIHK